MTTASAHQMRKLFAATSVATLLRKAEGWARRVEKRGKFTFVHLNDGQSVHHLQAVIPRDVCKKVAIGSALDMVGDFVKSCGSKQAMELLVTSCRVVGEQQTETNSLLHEVNAAILRKRLHLRPKSIAFSALLRLRAQLDAYSRQFFANEGFVHVDPPILSRNDCEGAGEVFTISVCYLTDQFVCYIVEIKHGKDSLNQRGKLSYLQGKKDFFGEDDVYLPVSSQLYLEALTCGLPRIYTIAPAIRADHSQTRQHLIEFRMLEAEFAFVDDLEQLCDIVEKYVKFVVQCMQNHGEETALVQKIFGIEESSDALINSSLAENFPRVNHIDACDVLKRKGEQIAQRFSKQNEFTLVKYCNGPLFVTRFPASQKPFYMKLDGNSAECFDFLAPAVGELAGGSLRETSIKALEMRGCGKNLDWYMDLRENGLAPSAGFGIGIERLLQTLYGVLNIKDTVAFPRWYKNCQC